MLTLIRHCPTLVLVSLSVPACAGGSLGRQDPYPPLKASAYECPSYEHAPACMSLTDRQEFLDYLGNMDVQQVSEVRCALKSPLTGKTREFVCGVLLFGAVEGIRPEDLQRICVLTDGQIARIPRSTYDFGILVVPATTEISSIGKIIYSPDLRYVQFDWVGGTTFLP